MVIIPVSLFFVITLVGCFALFLRAERRGKTYPIPLLGAAMILVGVAVIVSKAANTGDYVVDKGEIRPLDKPGLVFGAKTYPNWECSVRIEGDGWSVRATFRPKPTVESLTVSREELKGEYRRSVAGLDPYSDMNGFVFAAYRTADKFGVRLKEHRLEHDLLRVKPRAYTSP